MPGLPTLKAPALCAGSSSDNIGNPQTPNIAEGAKTPTSKGRRSEQSEGSTPKPRAAKPVSPKDSAVKEAQKVSNSAQKKVIDYRSIIPELRKETHQWPQEIATSLEAKMSLVKEAMNSLQHVMVDTDDVDTILAKTSECSTLVESMTEDYLLGKATLVKPKAKAKGKAKSKS